MRAARSILELTLASLFCACGSEPSPPPPARDPLPPPPPAVLASRRVSTKVAFDFAALGSGAVFAWGVPVAEGGGVRAILLDGIGGAASVEVGVGDQGIARNMGSDLGPTLVEEVTLVVRGERVAIAWIVRDRDRLAVEATQSSARLSGFSPPIDMGDAAPGSFETPQRGRVSAFNGMSGGFGIARQTPEANCNGELCARVVVRMLGESSTRSLEIEAPCKRPLVGIFGRGEALFEAVCHQGSNPGTTLYAIDANEPPLATAHEALQGCEPCGFTLGTQGAIAVGNCPSGNTAVEIGPRGDIQRVARSARHQMRCEEGRPILALEGQGRIEVPLGEPRSSIEALLPSTLAAEGSRAVWTGEAILVATPSGRDVAFSRHQCRDGALTRTDLL